MKNLDGICSVSMINLTELVFTFPQQINSMDYDINEHQTSIDNMIDTLTERLQVASIRDNIGDMKAIHDEWIVDDQDPEDGEYIFLFIENFAIQS